MHTSFQYRIAVYHLKLWKIAKQIGWAHERVVVVQVPSAPVVIMGSGGSNRTIGLDISLQEARTMAVEYKLPPIITLEEAALIARRSIYTIKRLVTEGRFKKSAKPGKPLLFHRDRFIQEVLKDH
ncbi:MAG: hypothetical protein JKY43_01080 [Phycisphaerales bacterium]|nr:hypothetical protein [Phycisphaerales bacterium]